MSLIAEGRDLPPSRQLFLDKDLLGLVSYTQVQGRVQIYQARIVIFDRGRVNSWCNKTE